MTFAFALHVLVGLSPVLGFLAALVFLDSYKLVAMRTVVLVVLSGVVAAIACYFANGWLLGRLGIGFAGYARYVGPVVEEIAKGLVIVALHDDGAKGWGESCSIIGSPAPSLEGARGRRPVPGTAIRSRWARRADSLSARAPQRRRFGWCRER